MALHEIPDRNAPSSQHPSTEQKNTMKTMTSKSQSTPSNPERITATSDTPLDGHTLSPIYYQRLANFTTVAATVGGHPSSLEGNVSLAPPSTTVNANHGPLPLGPPPSPPLPQLPPPNGLFTQPLTADLIVNRYINGTSSFQSENFDVSLLGDLSYDAALLGYLNQISLAPLQQIPLPNHQVRPLPKLRHLSPPTCPLSAVMNHSYNRPT